MKQCFLLTILFLLLTSNLFCQSKSEQILHDKKSMIEEFIQSVPIEHVKLNGKIIVIKEKACKELDCVEYFKNYVEKIEVLDMEDAFMKGYRQVITIKKIDTHRNKIIF